MSFFQGTLYYVAPVECQIMGNETSLRPLFKTSQHPRFLSSHALDYRRTLTLILSRHGIGGLLFHRYNAVLFKILGTRDQRGPGKPVVIEEDQIDPLLPRVRNVVHKAGGIDWERKLLSLKPVKAGSRTYQCGFSYQRTTGFLAPQRDGKWSAYGGSNAGVALRSEVIDVSISNTSDRA